MDWDTASDIGLAASVAFLLSSLVSIAWSTIRSARQTTYRVTWRTKGGRIKQATVDLSAASDMDALLDEIPIDAIESVRVREAPPTHARREHLVG